jgi:hypothetical protein
MYVIINQAKVMYDKEQTPRIFAHFFDPKTSVPALKEILLSMLKISCRPSQRDHNLTRFLFYVPELELLFSTSILPSLHYVLPTTQFCGFPSDVRPIKGIYPSVKNVAFASTFNRTILSLTADMAPNLRPMEGQTHLQYTKPHII